MFDKVKFWKKDDEFSDLSNLGDFGLDDKSGGGLGGGLGGGMDDLGGGFGDFPALGEAEKPGMTPGVPTHIEEVHPTDASRDMGDKLGLGAMPQPAQQPRQMTAAAPAAQSAAPQAYPAQQQSYPQQQAYAAPQQAYQQYQQAPGYSDMAKDVEIIHAKLDAIKSSLDSINQRLATLERMAGGGEQKRYTW
jgi:hypothetical protein